MKRALAPVLCAVLLMSAFVPFLAVPVSAAGYPSDITADNFYGTWKWNETISIDGDLFLTMDSSFYSNGFLFSSLSIVFDLCYGNDPWLLYEDYYVSPFVEVDVSYDSSISGSVGRFSILEEYRIMSFTADASNPTTVSQDFFDILTANATYQAPVPEPVTQYSSVSPIPELVCNTVANKISLLDYYILFQTGETEYCALVQNTSTKNTVKYKLYLDGSGVYQIETSEADFAYEITNEIYCFSNVGYGAALDLPVLPGVIAHAVVILACVFMFAIIFKGVLFPCLRKSRKTL